MRAGSLYSSILGVLAWACVSAAAARAQAPSALSWVREAGAESCIGAPELGARVERLVGPVLVAAPAAEVSVEGRIARRGQRFVARIVVSDARGDVLGERTVTGAQAAADTLPDCRALDAQLAFVIAVAIDPNAAIAELPGDLAPEGDPGAELLAELEANPPQPAVARAVPSPSRAVASERPRPSDARWHASFAGGLGVRVGALPVANGAFQLEAGAGVAWFTQRLGVALSRPQMFGEREVRVELGWLELGTVSCAELARFAFFDLELCAGVTVSRLSATPSGLTLQDARDRWLVGPRAAARVAVEIAAGVRLAFEAGALSMLPKHTIGYEADGALQEIHRVPTVTFGGALMIEVFALQ